MLTNQRTINRDPAKTTDKRLRSILNNSERYNDNVLKYLPRDYNYIR